MGRPPIAKSKVRQPGLSVRLRPDEDELIRAAIKASGLTKSEWMRQALLALAGVHRAGAPEARAHEQTSGGGEPSELPQHLWD